MGNKSAVAMFVMSGILILFATYASLLPDILESNTEVEIEVPADEVVNFLSDAENWEQWILEVDGRDESFRTMKAGKNGGEGSVLKWFSEVIGDGGLEVKKVQNDLIVFERISDNNSFRDRGYLRIENLVSRTNIKWQDSLDVSTSFMARYEAQDESYIHRIDSSNQEVLNRLKKVLESK